MWFLRNIGNQLQGVTAQKTKTYNAILFQQNKYVIKTSKWSNVDRADLIFRLPNNMVSIRQVTYYTAKGTWQRPVTNMECFSSR